MFFGNLSNNILSYYFFVQDSLNEKLLCDGHESKNIITFSPLSIFGLAQGRMILLK